MKFFADIFSNLFGWLFGWLGKPLGWTMTAAAKGLQATANSIDSVIGAVTGMFGLGARPAPGPSPEQQAAIREDRALKLSSDLQSYAARMLRGDQRAAGYVWRRLDAVNQSMLAEMGEDQLRYLAAIQLRTLTRHIEGQANLAPLPPFRVPVSMPTAQQRPGQAVAAAPAQVPMPKAIKPTAPQPRQAANDDLGSLEARFKAI